MALGDVLRGAYVRSPARLRRLAGPILARLPVRWRYGGTYVALRKAIARSETDADFVARYHAEKLRRIVALCVAGSAHYQRVFVSALGGAPDPERFRVEDLKRLPILTKDDVRERPEDFLAVPREQMDLVTTGGTSGVPAAFYLDRNRSPKEWAFVNHIWSKIGFEPSDLRAVLRGVMIECVDEKPWEFDAALNELRLSPFHMAPATVDEYLRLIKSYKASFIHGYPSAIEILASRAKETAWQVPKGLRGVFPISETLFPHQRELFREAFGGAAVLPFYGLSEKSAIAGEVVDEPDTYEFEPLYGIAELVDDTGSAVVEPGHAGRVVGTGFISTGMPLLRYDTGDCGVLVAPACRKNAYRLRVRNIRSRWDQKLLVGKDGAKISIAAINIHSPAYSRVVAFQFRQDRPGAADVMVIPKEGVKIEEVAPFVHEIQQKLGASLILNLRLVEQLETTARGKRPLIVQHLAPPLSRSAE